MIRTRFAPSPTGYLHIGGVRTALYNWLFARSAGGRFILRIDDTDVQRNVEEALQPILDGLGWLGIDWDEGPGVGGGFGPYYQSQRSQHYRAAAEELLRRGTAYRDYARPEELQAERQAARQAGQTFVYSRRFMAQTPQDRAGFEAESRSGVIRLKMPRQGKLAINDLVRGRVEFDWAREQDHVIQRADGSCLYHLASVVDDHQMQISHVIRGDDHLSNTPRQVFIAQSLGYELPEYAHLPQVAEPGSKVKLSKRKLDKYLRNREFARMVEHGRQIALRIGLQPDPHLFNPVVVDFYRQVGYLAGAIINYLALLGWSWDERTEHFTRRELIEKFSLDRVNKAPAGFDPQKLSAFEDWHMQQLSLQEKIDAVVPFLERAGLLGSIYRRQLELMLERILEALGDRIKVGGDILQYADFFFLPDEQLQYDENAFDKRIRKPDDAAPLLRKLRGQLAAAETFDATALEQLMHRFVDSEQIKVGRIIHALRVAVTGKSIGPGMFDCLEILGKESCLARIDRALELL